MSSPGPCCGEPVRITVYEFTPPDAGTFLGLFFRPSRANGSGPLKHTILVPAMADVAIDWVADNPGTWAYHCHNVYHQEAGMMRTFEVEPDAEVGRSRAGREGPRGLLLQTVG